MLFWWIAPVLVAFAIVIYALFLRPRLHEREELKEFYARCDSFWLSLWARIKAGWLMIASIALLIAPELPVFINELSVIDMSMLLPPDWARVITKLLALGGMIARFYIGVSMPRPEPR
jgi:hypothetical protein